MSAEPNEAGAGWDARLYDDKHAFVWKHGASLIEMLAPRAGERILDLGCGTGHLTAQIADVGADVLGIDASVAMIDEALRNFAGRPRLRFEQADARTFAEAAPIEFFGSFDAVFSNAVLHWVRPPEEAVRSIRKALKRGGRFVAEFGGHGNVQTIIAALRRVLPAYTDRDVVPPWYYPTIGEYAGLLEREGLEPVNMMLFERPTALDGPQGLRNWVAMFAVDAVAAVPAEKREEFFSRVEDETRAALFRDGVWYADYRRLRVSARAV